jgi:shikimate dehydrogenase
MTLPYAEVIGDPIAHSKSPLIHRFWLEALGLEGDYRAERVPPDALAAYLSARRKDPDWRGCNVTVPLKQAVLPLLDVVSREASAVGAVNTVYRDADGRLHGRNTDLSGLYCALDAPECRSADHAVLVGAGGAARAAAYVLKEYRTRKVTVMNRSAGNAERLLSEFGIAGEAVPLGPIPAADLVINASPLGMTGQPAFDPGLSALPERAVVFDMVYAPLETDLLRRARERGLRTVDGLVMLIGQAAEAFREFFGASPPRERDAELRRLLTR